jgi:DNA primase
MTHEQFKLLKRLTGKVVLAFDSDSAGQEALRRACLEALPLGLQVEVLLLKGFKDAGEVLTQKSPAFTDALEARKSWFQHFLAIYTERYALVDPAQKRLFSDAMLELVQAVDHPVEKEAYLSELSKILNIPKDLLKSTPVKAARLREQPENKPEKLRPEAQLLHRFLSYFLAFPSEFMTLWERYQDPQSLLKDLQATDLDSLILRPDRMDEARFAQFRLQFADFLENLAPESPISSVYKEQISHYTPHAQWDESFLVEHPERAQLQALQFQAQVQASQGVSVLSELTQLIAQLYLAYLRSPFHGSN